MNMDTIREWLHRQPFEPFELHLSNGEVYTVWHPELIMLGKTKLAVNYDPENERFAHVSLIHVNSIRPASPARSRKKRAS